LRAKNFYELFTRNELLKIAKEIGITGVSSLNKNDLKRVIIKALTNEDILIEILQSLPPRAVYILRIIMSFDKYEAPEDLVITEYVKMFDKKGFSKLLKTLESVGLACEIELDGDRYLVIPTEIAKRLEKIDIRKFLPKRTDIRSYRELLLRASTERLKSLLERHGFKKSGTKEKLIERIIKESKLDPIQVLTEIFLKEELIKFAEALGVKKEGAKEEIAQRIALRLGIIKGDTKEKEEKNKREEESLFQSIVKMLKEFRLYKPKDEADIEKQLVQYLKGRLEPESSVIPQALGIRRGKTLVPDITVEDKIAIEVKYIKTQADRQRLLGQLMDYKHNYPYVIAYCYDPHEKIDKRFLDAVKSLGENVEIIVVY